MKTLNLHPLFEVHWRKTEWPVIKEAIKAQVHNPLADHLLLTEMEVCFVGELSTGAGTEERHQILEKSPGWIGISHQVGDRLKEMKMKGLIAHHLANCLGVITLTTYAAEEWQKTFPGVRTATIRHPLGHRTTQFELSDTYDYRIRSLGKWKRKYDIWERLDSPYQKLPGSHELHYPAKAFDALFRDTIQFMDLEDASANNGVLECIRRNVPLLIRRHPAVVEYLGADYPFYFRNGREANEKINQPELIAETHAYLLEMDKTYLEIGLLCREIHRAT